MMTKIITGGDSVPAAAARTIAPTAASFESLVSRVVGADTGEEAVGRPFDAQPLPVADDSFLVALEDGETADVAAAAHHLASLADDRLDDDDLLTCTHLVARQLPERLVAALVGFRRRSNTWGSLLVRNLPEDRRLPPTPTGGPIDAWRQLPVSTANLLLVMSLLGEPIAYADEKAGALIQDICPLPGAEKQQENSGSVLLEFHTEDGFHPHKPDFVGLLCLRPDHDRIAKTTTASVRRALPRLPDTAIHVLRQPLYRIRLSSSFDDGDDDRRFSPPIAALSGDLLEPELCADFHAMEADTESARWAQVALERALLDVAVEVALRPCELILIDNRTAVHGRTGFRPRYDGEDRWLRRMFVVTDLRPSKRSRGGTSHVCAPLSLEHAVEPRSSRPATQDMAWASGPQLNGHERARYAVADRSAAACDGKDPRGKRP